MATHGLDDLAGNLVDSGGLGRPWVCIPGTFIVVLELPGPEQVAPGGWSSGPDHT